MRRRRSTGQKPNGASSTATLAAHIATPPASEKQVTLVLCVSHARPNVAVAAWQRHRRFKTRATGNRYSALTAERAARNETETAR
jgi:hypothetical protein